MEKCPPSICFTFGNSRNISSKTEPLFKCSNSIKINSTFLKQLAKKLCLTNEARTQMETKLALLRDNEKTFGQRIYAIFAKNLNTNTMKIINLHPSFFTLFYYVNGEYIKANNQILLSEQMIPLKLKFFGVYFNGFNIGLQTWVILLLLYTVSL